MELVASTAPAAASLLSTGGDAPVKAAPVVTQTSAIGIINPPPDIRSIVVWQRRACTTPAYADAFMRGDLCCASQDKTAQFVARNGPEFEKR